MSDSLEAARLDKFLFEATPDDLSFVIDGLEQNPAFAGDAALQFIEALRSMRDRRAAAYNSVASEDAA